MRMLDHIKAETTHYNYAPLRSEVPSHHQAKTKTIQIDLDETLAHHHSGRGILGDPHPNTLALVSKLHELGYRVEILTANPNLDVVGQWLVKHHIAFALVTNVKHPAVCYLDDRAVRYRGNESVEEILKEIRSVEGG